MRRNPEQDLGPEPTFEDYEIARRVMIHTRRWLEEQGEHVTLSDCPVFSHIVLNSSPVVNPALYERSQLASAEGGYERSYRDTVNGG
jgi:hypothetical protein